MKKKENQFYDEIMVNPHLKAKTQRGERIEDRLLKQGQQYKDKAAQIR